MVIGGMVITVQRNAKFKKRTHGLICWFLLCRRCHSQTNFHQCIRQWLKRGSTQSTENGHRVRGCTTKSDRVAQRSFRSYFVIKVSVLFITDVLFFFHFALEIRLIIIFEYICQLWPYFLFRRKGSFHLRRIWRTTIQSVSAESSQRVTCVILGGTAPSWMYSALVKLISISDYQMPQANHTELLYFDVWIRFFRTILKLCNIVSNANCLSQQYTDGNNDET